MYSPDSIELLQKSGMDLERNEQQGIEPNDFAELMITSGLVLAENTKWISFHRRVTFIFLFFLKRLDNPCLESSVCCCAHVTPFLRGVRTITHFVMFHIL